MGFKFTPELVIIACILLLFFVAVIKSLTYMINTGEKVFDELRVIKQKALDAKTKSQLQAAWEELIEVNKKCWHKSHNQRVVEIKAIIETKFDMIDVVNKAKYYYVNLEHFEQTDLEKELEKQFGRETIKQRLYNDVERTYLKYMQEFGTENIIIMTDKIEPREYKFANNTVEIVPLI